MEMKLGQARDLLASETSLRKKAENERCASRQALWLKCMVVIRVYFVGTCWGRSGS